MSNQRPLITLFAAVLLMASAHGAAAQPAVVPAAPPAPPSPGRSYLPELIAMDVASVGAIIAGGGLEGDDSPLSVAGWIGLVAGGPAIHAAHGGRGVAAHSLALHVVAPMGGGAIGAVVGMAAANEDDGLAALGPVVLGIVIGELAGLVISRAYDYTHARAAVRRHVESAPRVALAPAITPRADGATFGLVGRY